MKNNNNKNESTTLKKITISKETVTYIEYFNQLCFNNGLSTAEFRKYTTQPLIKALLEQLDNEVTDDFKFVFDKTTNSFGSISGLNMITEFGGNIFRGDIIEYIKYKYNVNFKYAWDYIKICFGANIILPPLAEESTPLPDPSLFMKRLILMGL